MSDSVDSSAIALAVFFSIKERRNVNRDDFGLKNGLKSEISIIVKIFYLSYN